MKAVLTTRYGPPDVLTFADVERPVPAFSEVLVRVHATTVSRTDCGNLRGHPRFARLATGLTAPKNPILGMDFAGTVEAVGHGVVAFEVGDRVFGLSPETYGAHAEYLSISATGPVAAIPGGLSFSEVVMAEGAWYADCNLKHSGLGPGRSILIYGGSGAIGVAAVQLAKFYGADVTAVVETRHLDLATSLGADSVIDYTAEDLTDVGRTFDVVMDAVGKTSYSRCRKLLQPDGRYVATDLGPGGQNIWLSLWYAMVRSRRVAIPIPVNADVFVPFLADRLAAGDVRAVIDRRYPFDRIADAYRFVETGQKTGIVVIDVVRES